MELVEQHSLPLPPSIGVVGGMGPSAGFALAQQIVANTVASSDAEHLPVVVFSWPALVSDRTQFIRGETQVNPAQVIGRTIQHLEAVGARCIGIPCCTAHCPAIMDEVVSGMRQANCSSALVHLSKEVARYISVEFPIVKRVGVLCTQGAYEGRAFDEHLHRHGLELLSPDARRRSGVHEALYDPDCGIKSNFHQIDMARPVFLEAIDHLVGEGAEAVILGCTELGLVITETDYGGIPLVNPTTVLARELIRHVAPSKLLQEHAVNG